MATDALIRSRTDPDVKQRATAVLDRMGLSVSDVMRSVLTRVADDGELPFDMKLNALTRGTLRRSANGEGVHQARDAKDLFDQLGI